MIVQPDFLTHWKTKKLINRLKDQCAPLYVIRLWSLCHTSKSDVIPADHETIAAICEYEGDPEKFAKAMLDCGFIEPEHRGNHVVHGWSEVNQRLIHNWTVGPKGGRPRGAKPEPPPNPRVDLKEPAVRGTVQDAEVDLWTLEDVIKHASSPDCGVTKEMAQTCYDHYAAAGWINANGVPVGRSVNMLKSLLRKWKSNQSSHGKRGELPDAPPKVDRKPKADDLVSDCVRDLWAKRNDDAGFKRCLSVWRDKTKDMPEVIKEALDIIAYKRERGEK